MMSGAMNADIGRELKDLRESKEITLAQAARDTCMREGLLRELEECTDIEQLPEIYRKLSLRMYARYLGMEFEVTRRATHTAEGIRIAPVGMFVRRMGRPPKPARLDPAQRNRLLSVVKATSAAVVTVLAVGLWSLNAKISRLHFDEKPVHAPEAPQEAVQEVIPAKTTVVFGLPHMPLEENVSLTLVPVVPPCEGHGL